MSGVLRRRERPFIIKGVTALFFIAGLMCVSVLLFSSLYFGDWATSAALVLLGYLCTATAHSLWNLKAWAWYAAVFLLALLALADCIYAVIHASVYAALRTTITCIVLAFLAQPKVRKLFY